MGCPGGRFADAQAQLPEGDGACESGGYSPAISALAIDRWRTPRPWLVLQHDFLARAYAAAGSLGVALQPADAGVEFESTSG